MTKPLLILSILLISLSGCEEDSLDNPGTTGIVGTWVWFKTQGFGVFHTAQSTGQTWTLDIRSDFSFTKSGNYFLVQSEFPDNNGTYSLLNSGVLCVTIPINGNFIRFTSPNMSEPVIPAYIINSGDTLILDTGAACDNPLLYLVRN